MSTKRPDPPELKGYVDTHFHILQSLNKGLSREEVLGAAFASGMAATHCATMLLKTGDQVYNPIKGKKERIGRMVHPVMGRRIENKLNGPRQFADGLSMNPELIDDTTVATGVTNQAVLDTGQKPILGQASKLLFGLSLQVNLMV